MDTIGELTGQVAHDFNNLLMAVLGSLTLLEKNLPDDPQCRRLLHNAVRGGQRGASLAKRLLAFSRRQELKPESVDIGELVVGWRSCSGAPWGSASNSSVSSRHAVPVLVDANQLELALLNVALNARDAMPDGGRLMISAEETEYAGAADSSLPPGVYVRIKIVDTGVGMDEATRTKRPNRFSPPKAPAWQPVWVFPWSME